MRKIAAALALFVAAACARAEPSAGDLALVEKYQKASFSAGAAAPTKDYGDSKLYALPDKTRLWVYKDGTMIAETPDKAVVRIYVRNGKEVGREISLPSGRTCQVGSDGELEWDLVTESAPDFSLAVLGGSGAKVRLSDRGGKLILLDFWASWCQPCMRALPETEKLYQKYKGRGLEVYGINIEGSEAKASSAGKSLGLTFPLLMGEPDARGRYDWSCRQIADYRVSAIPATFLIDGSGVVLAMNPSESQIAARLRP